MFSIREIFTGPASELLVVGGGGGGDGGGGGYCVFNVFN